MNMDVNNVTTTAAAYQPYESKQVSKSAAKETAQQTAKTGDIKPEEAEAVVYEKSDAQVADKANKSYKPDTDKVQQMLRDSEEKVNSFKTMIQKMFGQQAKTSSIADDMWQMLAKGDFTVDAATKAQAQADIGEDGYWGVKQTSGRILDFAKALTGGDPEKMEKMRSAFEKGYKQAEKTWGGKLPDISKQTYDAVMKGFDDLAAGVTE